MQDDSEHKSSGTVLIFWHKMGAEKNTACDACEVSNPNAISIPKIQLEARP